MLHFPNSAFGLFSRVHPSRISACRGEAHGLALQADRSPRSPLSWFLSFLLLFTLTNAAAPTAAVDLAGGEQSHLPEFRPPSIQQQLGSLFNQCCLYGNPECQKLFLPSQEAAVNRYDQDRRVWRALYASTLSKIQYITAVKLSVQKCSSISWAIRHIGFFQVKYTWFVLFFFFCVQGLNYCYQRTRISVTLVCSLLRGHRIASNTWVDL